MSVTARGDKELDQKIGAGKKAAKTEAIVIDENDGGRRAKGRGVKRDGNRMFDTPGDAPRQSAMPPPKKPTGEHPTRDKQSEP